MLCGSGYTCTALSPQEEAAWATAMMLVLLEKDFDIEKKEWKLLAIKAKDFIAGCGEQLEDLLAKARLILAELQQEQQLIRAIIEESQAEPSE